MVTTDPEQVMYGPPVHPGAAKFKVRPVSGVGVEVGVAVFVGVKVSVGDDVEVGVEVGSSGSKYPEAPARPLPMNTTSRHAARIRLM